MSKVHIHFFNTFVPRGTFTGGFKKCVEIGVHLKNQIEDLEGI